MAAAAVTARLREAARLLQSRRFVSKEVDLRPAAVTARLKMMGALSDMCRKLVAVGQTVPSTD